MDFNTLLDNRKTNFTWTNEQISNGRIIEIVNNVLSKVPSKQKRMPYKIDVFDNSNQSLRKYAKESLNTQNVTTIQL